jgi:hypothetical protein
MINAGGIDPSMPDGLRAALTYARRGWPVAPAHSPRSDRSCSCSDAACDRIGKHPRTRHGLTDATTDEKTIREWWQKWPDANVLIRTGKVGDRYLVALDVDVKHDGEENLARVLNEHAADLPDTPRAITGGGGSHVFMWSRLPVKSSVGSNGGIAPGVDVRGVGGYVIAAPSRHESGREYTWDAGAHPADLAIAEAPAWFVAVAGLAGERVKVKPSDVEGAEISEIFEGGRNNALMRIAGAMRRPGVGERAILAALRIVNDDRCRPPLDDWEVEKIARSIARCEPGDPVKPGSDPLPLVTWAHVASPLPVVKWTLEALGIAPGAPTIIGGAGGGGKTMALQAMIVAIASGRKVWGQFNVEQGRAIHIDYEQGDRITRERYQRIANVMGVDLLSLPSDSFGLAVLPRYCMKPDQATEDTIVRVCTGARVAVIDAFRGAFPEARENDSDVRKHLDMLQHASERTGCTMIVIAHSRKAVEGDDVRSALRGSSALFDAAQTVYMLDGENGKPTRVHNTKDRVVGGINGKLRETFGIQINDVEGVSDHRLDRRWGLDVSYLSTPEVQAAYMQAEAANDDTFAASADRLITAANRIIAHLQASPEGVTLVEIRAFCNITSSDAIAVMTGLVRDGKVAQEGRGTNALYKLSTFIG